MDIKQGSVVKFIDGISVTYRPVIKKAPIMAKMAVASTAPAVTAPMTFDPPQSMADTREHLKVHLPDIKLLIKAAILILLAVAVILVRLPLANLLSSAYQSVDKRISLLINPLPPVSANERLVEGQQQLSQVITGITDQRIDINLAGTKLLLPKAQIRSWINTKSEKYNYDTLSINEQAVSQYLANQIKGLTKTPVNQVTVPLSNGTSSTIQNGVSGLSFPSDNNLVSEVTQQLIKGNGVNGQLPGVSVPFTTVNHPSNDKLLEVNVTTKRMYAYDDGVLVRTFLISAGAPATPTPLGTFHIWEKLPVQDMVAYYPDGQLEYNQPNVQWVNYFDHSGDAIHGNYWRPLSYFGNINSSHGCVGVVNSDAEWIYDWAPIGTTVIIHA